MYCEFREVRGQELATCFDLRDKCYRTTISDCYVESEEFRQHDEHARHFAMFRRDHSDHQIVGYVRVAEAFPVFSSLPFFHFLGPRGLERARRMLDKLFGKHRMIVEPGRLSVTGSVGQMMPAKFVVACLTALYGLDLEVPALLTCAEKHRRFYEVLGFRQVLTDEDIKVPWKRHLNSICMLRVPRANERAHARLFMMLDAYRRYGAIAHNPRDPENFTPMFLDVQAMDSSMRSVPRAAA